MSALETAAAWISRGFSVIPLGYRSKRPAFDALKATRCITEDGNLTWEPFKDRQATQHELELWFRGPRRNLGVVTGYQGLVVLDFDELEAYYAWYAWAMAEGGTAADVAAGTYRVESSRGMHVYLMVEEEVESYHIGAVDVKACWGYVLIPPSVHPSGHIYQGYGNSVMWCAQLRDVFPFEPPQEVSATTSVDSRVLDPWESASRAVECGEGSIKRIRENLQLSELLGVQLGDRRTVRVRCPLHDDEHPSMLVYSDGHCRCLAGCNGGKQMDIIDVYAALHHLSNREAIAELAQKVG